MFLSQVLLYVCCYCCCCDCCLSVFVGLIYSAPSSCYLCSASQFLLSSVFIIFLCLFSPSPPSSPFPFPSSFYTSSPFLFLCLLFLSVFLALLLSVLFLLLSVFFSASSFTTLFISPSLFCWCLFIFLFVIIIYFIPFLFFFAMFFSLFFILLFLFFLFYCFLLTLVVCKWCAPIPQNQWRPETPIKRVVSGKHYATNTPKTAPCKSVLEKGRHVWNPSRRGCEPNKPKTPKTLCFKGTHLQNSEFRTAKQHTRCINKKNRLKMRCRKRRRKNTHTHSAWNHCKRSTNWPWTGFELSLGQELTQQNPNLDRILTLKHIYTYTHIDRWRERRRERSEKR